MKPRYDPIPREELRRFACDGKQGFNSYREGAAAIKRIRKFQGGDRALYRCSYCPCWHIGSQMFRKPHDR